jgi:hypothetical protein
VLYQDEPCPEPKHRKVVAPAPSKPPASTAERGAPAGVPPAPVADPAPRPREWSVIEPAGADRLPGDAGGALHAPSGRFASPESTWRAFVSAIGRGDRAAAAACLTSSALVRLGGGAESFPLEELRATVSVFTRIAVDGEVGPFWSIHASRPGLRPKWIFFERTARGEWKIAAI